MTTEKIKKVKSAVGATKDKKTESKPKPALSAAVAEKTVMSRREVTGIVVSDKMQKTIVVRVDRKVRDPEYKKYVLHSQKVKAHDETNSARVGDQVLLVASRPISRDKRWALNRILRRDGESIKVNVSK